MSAPLEYPKTMTREGATTVAFDAENESVLEAEGWRPAGVFDPEAYEEQVNGEDVEEYVPKEFPKWIHPDGVPGENSYLANSPRDIRADSDGVKSAPKTTRVSAEFERKV